jgi:glucokinase
MMTGDRIGIDIGGTAIKAVRVAENGHILKTTTTPAGGNLDRAALLDLTRSIVSTLASGGAIGRVGVAVGGVVRPDGVMPADATNLPSLAGVPLPALFANVLGQRCSVINDAHAAMHGEAWVGHARDARHAAVVTFGTCIGVGLLLDGAVRRGANGAAGELGAWPIAAKPNSGSLETMAAPSHFESRFGRRLGSRGFAHGSDPETDAALDAIGHALAGVHLLLDLEMIVLAGAITLEGDAFRSAVDAAFRRACPAGLQADVRVVVSTLGPYAGAVGAVAPSVTEPST